MTSPDEFEYDDCKVYVPKLAGNISKEVIHGIFEKYGTVLDVSTYKTSAFVLMSTPEECAAAIKGLDNKPPIYLSATLARKNNKNQRSYNSQNKPAFVSPGSKTEYKNKSYGKKNTKPYSKKSPTQTQNHAFSDGSSSEGQDERVTEAIKKLAICVKQNNIPLKWALKTFADEFQGETTGSDEISATELNQMIETLSGDSVSICTSSPMNNNTNANKNVMNYKPKPMQQDINYSSRSATKSYENSNAVVDKSYESKNNISAINNNYTKMDNHVKTEVSANQRNFVAWQCAVNADIPIQIVNTDEGGHVCLTMDPTNAAMMKQYESLCSDFITSCESEKSSEPAEGILMAVKLSEDNLWYRALLVTSKDWALVDDGRTVPTASVMKITQCPKDYKDIPEFCCFFAHSATSIDNSLLYKMKVVSKNEDNKTLTVNLSNVESSVNINGTIKLWKSPQAPKEQISAKGSAVSSFIKSHKNVIAPLSPPRKFSIEMCKPGEEWSLRAITTDKNSQVCLVMNSKDKQMVEQYSSLLDEFTNCCEKMKDSPAMQGVIMAVKLSTDAAWYRAIQTSEGLWALVDDGNSVPRSKILRVVECAERFLTVPEFCCILENCPPLKNDVFYLMSLINKENDNIRLQVKIRIKGVAKEYTGTLTPFAVNSPAHTVAQKEDSVSNDPLKASALSKYPLNVDSEYVMVKFVDLDRMYLRPADSATNKKHLCFLDSLAVYGQSAPRLNRIPQVDEVVVCEYKNDQFQRGVVNGVNSKNNMCSLLFVDIGELETVGCESLLKPPAWVTNSPILSDYSLGLPIRLNQNAIEYVRNILENKITLKIKSQNGDMILLKSQNSEDINKRLIDLCTPEWKKLQQEGKGVLGTEVLFESDVKYQNLEPGQKLTVSNTDILPVSSITCVPSNQDLIDHLQTLTEQMTEYCQCMPAPYLPRDNEICIYKSNDDQKWYRALAIEIKGDNVEVLSLDTGKVDVVNFSSIRKMLKEFIKPLPALGSICIIEGYPEKPFPLLISRTREILKTMSTFIPDTITKTDNGVYRIQMSELITQLTNEGLLSN